MSLNNLLLNEFDDDINSIINNSSDNNNIINEIINDIFHDDLDILDDNHYNVSLSDIYKFDDDDDDTISNCSWILDNMNDIYDACDFDILIKIFYLQYVIF